MKYLVLFVILFLSNISIGGQFPLYQNYKWDSSPKLDTNHFSDQLYYYTKYKLMVEYILDDNDYRFYKYQTLHYKVKLNSHIAIEYFNKVYISMEDVVDLKNLKARLIKPSGAKEVDVEVEEFYSSDESEQYYYFPISGIELGDEIEILYTLKMYSKVDGDRYQIQGSAPIFNFDFYFVSPDDAFFKFVAHNGLPKPQLADSIRSRNFWSCHLDTVPAFKNEYFTEYNNVTMRLDIALKGFDNPSDDSYSTWENYETSLNNAYNVQFSKADIYAAKTLSTRIGIKSDKSDLENVRLIENYIKQNMCIGGIPANKTSLQKNIQEEKASSYETILLYMLLFQVNEIPFEFGFISDRYDVRFNDMIESAEFLQYFIFHFPSFNGYMSPLYFASRTGFLDFNWVPNNALLFKMKSYPVKLTQAHLVEVAGTDARSNLDSTIIRITIHDDFVNMDIEIERHLSGYEVGEFQSYYYLYNDSRKAEEEEILLDVLNDYSRFKMTNIANANPEAAYIKPLIIHGVVSQLNVNLMDVAGDKIIFRVGDIFGEFTDTREILRKKTDFIFGNAFVSSKTIMVGFPQGTKLTANQVMPESDDLIPQEDIAIYSHFKIEGHTAILSHGSTFTKSHYPLDEKDAMLEVFDFWNSLHKYCLIVEKP